jgi:3-oxoacyl-[acyl-carrier protein] reductase
VLTIDLSNRVALVTGSSRGIGLATAERLFAAGANVVLNNIAESEELAAAGAKLAAQRADGVAISVGDVGDPEAAKQIVRTAFNRWKRLDILVNNAGILRDNLIGMIPDEDIHSVLATNLVGVIATIQHAARLIARNKNGSIVNISSIIGVRGNRGELVYGASKAGVIGATLSAAKELAPLGVRVNAIAPGFIDTAMTAHLRPEVRAERIASIAMGRIGKPEDVANTVLFLASEYASYVTGQVIGVDGGMLI